MSILTYSREHILKGTLRNTPVGNAESVTICFHGVEQTLGSETFKWDLEKLAKIRYLINKVPVEFSDEDGTGQFLLDKVLHPFYYFGVVEYLIDMVIILATRTLLRFVFLRPGLSSKLLAFISLLLSIPCLLFF